MSPSSYSALNASNDSTQFAYQAMLGVGYNIDPMFRINLEGRYYGTTSPYLGAARGYTNNNFSAMAELQVKFGAPAARAAAAAAAGCRRRRSWCSSIGTARTCRSRP